MRSLLVPATRRMPGVRTGVALAIALTITFGVQAVRPMPALAIVDGTVDGTAHPAVGAVLVSVDGGVSECSGVLVRSTVYGLVFLTAAHCADGATGVPAEVAFDPAVSPATRYYGGTFWADPAWSPANEFNLPADNHDVGVVVFGPAQKPKIKPLPIAPLGSVATLPLGTQLTAVGYGISDPTTFSGDGTRRDGTMSLADVYGANIDWLVGPSNTCFGDSGGPELATIAGAVEVVAVTNYGDFRCASFGVGYRVDTTEVQALVNAAYPGGPS
jgi:Trypsin-like peptidase domain